MDTRNANDVVSKTADQDAGVRWTVAHAYHGSPFFRRLFDGTGVAPGEVRGVDDLPSLPFTTKSQLSASYPFGWSAVPPADVVRVHASSGTTGRRVVMTYTAQDIDDWTAQFARCFSYAGVTREDLVQVTPGYGLWTAGIGFQAGVERIGATAVPTGPGNVDLQFEAMLDFGTTVLCATSSFGLLLAEEVQQRCLRDRLQVRVGIFGSERWGETMRERIATLLGVDTYDIYGLTELYGPGTGLECARRDGIHYWDDYYLVEIVDPASDRPLSPGEPGEIVLTTLRKEGTPLIRYRTRDISYVYPEPCPCGSPYPRIGRLTGRLDDMVKVRGVQIYPAQIDRAIAQVPEVSSEYQVHIDQLSGRDELLVKAETATPGAGVAEALARAVRREAQVRAEVELVEIGALSRSTRKSRRIFDHRRTRE